MIKKVINFLGLTLFLTVCSWFIGYWSVDNFKSPIGFLYNWQQLVGSFLGAITPIGLFLINEEYQRRKKQKDHLLLLEKSLISAINNLADIDKMLHSFFDESLEKVKNKVTEDDKAGLYSVGQAFVPLSSTFSFDREILKETTNSSYLENLKLDVFSTSHELPLLLQDIGRQFDRTITLNTQLGIGKLNSANMHNKMFLENLGEFNGFLSQQTFGHNIPVYLRKLVSTLIPLQKMNKWGLKKWRRTFTFKPPFSSEVSNKMTDYFKEEVNKYILSLQSEFKSKLLIVGE